MKIIAISFKENKDKNDVFNFSDQKYAYAALTFLLALLVNCNVKYTIKSEEKCSTI